MYKQKTSVQTKTDSLKKKWFHIDANGKILGRLAARIALILKGKHKPTYTPNLDCGDYIVVTNVEKVVLTGNKLKDKQYFWHTNHIGGIKNRSAEEFLIRKPDHLLYEAVRGMLPKNSLGRAQLTKLRLFVGTEHEHTAQQPELITLTKE
jgi:large subunit ribosomal protein L13